MSRQRNVTIKLDNDIYKEVQKTFKERGTSLEIFIKLQLIAFTKSAKGTLDLKDKMHFGKYAGALVEDIIRGDTNYAFWLMSQDGKIKFSGSAIELINELVSK